MKLLDVTLDSPAENLACDEALLDLCEKEGVETLRFWESREHFVVVGYGNRIDREVNVEECKRRSVRILRRCSGGGTVVQGPGCLNYSVTLRIPDSGPLTTVAGTNELVMERNRRAMEQLLNVKVSIQGHTDLAILGHASLGREEPWLKFSGNAQRRRRRALVFHGTILHAFDLSLVDSLLRFPSAQPDYRRSRKHADFVCNVPVSVHQIRTGLRESWHAVGELIEPPREQISRLVREQYANAEWTQRR